MSKILEKYGNYNYKDRIKYMLNEFNNENDWIKKLNILCLLIVSDPYLNCEQHNENTNYFIDVTNEFKELICILIDYIKLIEKQHENELQNMKFEPNYISQYVLILEKINIQPKYYNKRIFPIKTTKILSTLIFQSIAVQCSFKSLKYFKYLIKFEPSIQCCLCSTLNICISGVLCYHSRFSLTPTNLILIHQLGLTIEPKWSRDYEDSQEVYLLKINENLNINISAIFGFCELSNAFYLTKEWLNEMLKSFKLKKELFRQYLLKIFFNLPKDIINLITEFISIDTIFEQNYLHAKHFL